MPDILSPGDGVGVGVGVGGMVGVAVAVAVAVAVGVAVAVAVAVTVAVAVAVAVAVGVDVGVGDGVIPGLSVGVGVGVAGTPGPWIATAIGDPVLKKPTVALVLCGGPLASKRKLYNVPQRIAFAFGSFPKVSELQVRELDVWAVDQGVLLNPVFPAVLSFNHPGS